MQLTCDGGDVIRLARDIDWHWGAVVHPLLPWKQWVLHTLSVCL